MGVILDSSVVIAVERRGLSPQVFLEQLALQIGDEEVALTAVSYTELVHGLYRADNEARRTKRQGFLTYLTDHLIIHAYTKEAAEIAGRIDAESRTRQITIPFPDLLIGATALSLNFSVLTVNVRHFRLIPGLNVIPF